MVFRLGRPSIALLFIFGLVDMRTLAFRRKTAAIAVEPEVSEGPSLEELLAQSQNALEEDEANECPPDGDKCCAIGPLYQSTEFLQQSLGMGIEQCLQLNIDLAQAFATAALYVPIQIVFAAQGIYDFGFGAGSSGNALQHQLAAERRKLTSSVSAAVQVTIIPKALYVYVSLTYQVQAYQRSLDTHPYELSMKEIVSLVTRTLLGKKYLTMRFKDKPDSQAQFIGSLLDMYTFTDGFPTDNEFLDRYEALVDQSSDNMTWPNATATEEQIASMRISDMRKLLLDTADDLKNKFGSAFWKLDNPQHHKALFDCYTYFEAYLDTVYKTDIALTGDLAISEEQLNTIRKDRDSYDNRYKNETFADGFSSGGAWYNRRGRYKRVTPDPAFLCDKYQDALYCRERLAMCLSLEYDPEDFEASELKGQWPPQFLNSFPEVVTALNEFEHLYRDSETATKKALLIPTVAHALKTMSQIQPTFMTLFRAREGTTNACEVRGCSGAAAEESGEMIVEDLEDYDGDDSTELTTAREVKMAVKKLTDGPWLDGLPVDSLTHTLYYAHAPPTGAGKGLGGVGTCLAKAKSGNCEEWTRDVQEWGRSEQAMWAAILSKDPEKVKSACDLPNLQFNLRNPYNAGLTFVTKARELGVEDALRECPTFADGGASPVEAPIHFRPYVVQRLWMRTVAQAHLALDTHHKELRNVEDDPKTDPRVYKAFLLEYATTVSFEATLDLNYVDFCKSTGAPIAVGKGVTWTGKLIHEYDADARKYLLKDPKEHMEKSDTKKLQIIMPDGSVKFFAEWGKGTVSDDFDLTNIEKKYELQMSSPGVMAAFAAVLGLSKILSKLSPFVSRTITGEVVKEAEGEDGLTKDKLEGIISRAWERQQARNASGSVMQWFSKIGRGMVKAAENQMTCTLSAEALGMFLIRGLTMDKISSIGSMIGTLGAAQAQNLYETAPVYAGAWFGGRLDMLVSHTAEKCHKMLRPQLKAYFRAGFNAPFVSGAYTAAFFVRVSLPVTPKNMILPERNGKEPRRKQYCGLLGGTGKPETCRELRKLFEVLDSDGNHFVSREEVIAGFNKNEAVAQALLGLNDFIGWGGFYKHFGFSAIDCKSVDEDIQKNMANFGNGRLFD